MKYSTGHRDQQSERSRSSSSALNPYLIDDIAMTPSDLERTRTDDIAFVVSR